MSSIVANNKASAKDVLELAAREGVQFVNLQFSDILGVVKSVTIPINQLEDAIEHGKWFDGSSIEGFCRIAESDMYLLPDLSTFAVIPWQKGLARVICWVYTPDGELFAGDPRAVLAKTLQEAKELGYTFNVGPELEFFLFKKDEFGNIDALPHDRGGYFDLTTDEAFHIREDMTHALEALGIKVETAHHEVAAGQHEIDFQYAEALTTADNALTFRYTLKAIAQKHGLHTTFMPKPIHGINGSGMHCHMSLFDINTGNNAFYDGNDPYGLSKTARHFIAGILAHAKSMIAVWAPLVNSYKRLVPGYEAPVYISWARNNRSALVRIPRVSPTQPKATRVELRCPDPSCNPYLAFALMLKAGLDGIKRELPLMGPVEENLYDFDAEMRAARNVEALPGSLGKAIEAMEADPLVRETMGEHLYARYLEGKTQEWDEYRTQVSQWELDRYLSIY